MVGDRKSRPLKEQILELYRRKTGKRKIAEIFGISKNTVKGVIRAAEAKLALAPDAIVVGEAATWASLVSWAGIGDELGKRYVTVKCLHADYAPLGVGYLAFWRELRRRFPRSLEGEARIRKHHEPGARLEIDYCDGIPITDRKSGTTKKTHLFAAVSSFSDYTFGEFSFTQKREEFIQSQDRMFHFYGGVFPYLVVDNLKSGVQEAHIYDPDVNPGYIDYANHMGFAVLPARPRTPRDKPAIEGNIGVIQRQFFAEVRNRIFYSLSELNETFRTYLKTLNESVMKDYGVTRSEKFAIERGLLKLLPAAAFEVAEYRRAKVHPDCHVQVEKNFYSVPYRFIGQTLRIRLTPKLIEIFNADHESVAIHTRLRKIGGFQTIDGHYPAEKLATARFDVQIAKRDAARSGPEMEKLILRLLEGSEPLRYLRRIQGILRLRKIYTGPALEYACHQAMLFDRLRLRYITECAKKFELTGYRPRIIGAPARDLASVYLQNPEGPQLL